MRDLVVLVLHLVATVARLAGRGGARSVVAESILVKHQLLILNHSRRRARNPYLDVCETPADRLRGGTVVKPEHAAEPLPAPDRALSDRRVPRSDERVVQALVGPFLLIMRYELSNSRAKVSF